MTMQLSKCPEVNARAGSWHALTAQIGHTVTPSRNDHCVAVRVVSPAFAFTFLLLTVVSTMAASSFKMKRSERKNLGIPIPSFSCVSPSNKKSPPLSTTVPAKWNQSSLSKAETALHVSRIRSGPTKWTPEGLLRLDDFYVLCRQLSLVEVPKAASEEDADGLSLPERLLCDLVCVSSPSLYQLVQNDDNDWCLQMVHYQGNRLSGLGRLMMRPEVDVAKRDATLKTILEHRMVSQKRKVEQETPVTPLDTEETRPSPQKVIQEPFIRDGMSLEERVRARAAARQQREADASSKNRSDKPDYSSLLRLADAMWSHSRRNIRRQSQIFSMSSAPFSMTVKDVVRTFAGSLVTSSSRTAQLHREKATRTEMLQALRDLQQVVPEFISFSSSPNKPLSKDTTVWLSTTVDISSVRTKLGAPKSSSQTKRPLETKKAPARVSLSPPTVATKDDATTPSPSKKQRRSPRFMATLRKRKPQDTLLSPFRKRNGDFESTSISF